jgi:subfamily B ATP-binding cassette protein HlyB/CyaB
MMDTDHAEGSVGGPESGAVSDAMLVALRVLLRCNDIVASEEEIRRRTGLHDDWVFGDMATAAGEFGLAGECRSVRAAGLAHLPTPFIAETSDGAPCLVASVDAQGVALLDPVTGDEERLLHSDLGQRLSGRVVLTRPASADDAAIGGGHGFGLRSFLPRLLRFRGVVGQLLVASLFIQLFAMATPLFTMVIIDKVLSTGAHSTLNVLAIGLVAIALFDVTIGLLRGALFSNLTHRLDVELSAGLFRHLSRLPMSFFGGRKTGDTVARVRELETVRQFLTGPTLTALVDFAFAFVFLGVMALFSVKLTLIVIAAIVLMLALYAVAAPLMKRRLDRRFGSSADNESFLVEAVGGMETMKSLSLEPQMQARWERQAVEQTRTARESERLTSSLSQIAQFFNKGTVALTLFLGAQAVIAGDLTAGQLIAFNMMVGRVMAPALRLAQLFQQLSQTKVSVQRLADIFDARTEPAAGISADSLPPMRGRVRFDQVTFRYLPDMPDALRDVSFEVEAGEVIGIVGGSGAGKTSLLRLLQRLYVPQGGRVMVDGVNIAEVDPAWLRRSIGAVTQDSVLFNATVRENIAAANPQLSIEAIERAARLAAADDFIRALPKAYDTPVGERGQQLSMGQRQRIALARALACDPRILVLDEPTSALDAHVEHEIQDNLREMVRGRTVFIVSHRLSMLRVADRILVLDEGRLVEAGPPEQLRRADGPFARLEAAQRPFTRDAREEPDEATA